jgi:hypothetical protein
MEYEIGKNLIDVHTCRKYFNHAYPVIDEQERSQGEKKQPDANSKQNGTNGGVIRFLDTLAGEVPLDELLIAAPDGRFKHDIGDAGRPEIPGVRRIECPVEPLRLAGLGGQFPGFRKGANGICDHAHREHPAGEENEELHHVRPGNRADSSIIGVGNGHQGHQADGKRQGGAPVLFSSTRAGP